ncbi:MAG: deoxyribonuclease IV [Candidatus Hodarchaeales archaeon]|jgi:deoxyribonuclease-4
MTKEKIIGPRIGAHKSIAKSIDLAVDRGVQSTCECLQIFTRPPIRWAAGKKSLSPEIINRFIQKSETANYYDTTIHVPYLPNLASPDEDLFNRSVEVLIEEVKKTKLLHTPYVVTHLGSPKDRDVTFGVKRVSEALNNALNHIQQPSMILLENSTARKKIWGNKIEHIEAILGQVEEEQFIGICFDTAHAYSSGYNISSPEGLNEVIDSIEELLGKDKLKLIHINDSKAALGSGIDHHEHIGKGCIGIDCFRELMQNPRFKEIPMILETPKDDKIRDKQNLELLRKLRSNN